MRPAIVASLRSMREQAIAAAQRNGAALWFVRSDVGNVARNSDGSGGAPALGEAVGYLGDAAGSVHAIQGTAAARPTLVALASGSYALGHSLASAHRLAPASLATKPAAETLMWAGTFAAECNGVIVTSIGRYQSATASGVRIGRTTAGLLRLSASNGVSEVTVQTIDVPADTPVVASVRAIEGENMRVRSNGSALDVTTTVAFTGAAYRVAIGANNHNGTTPFGGSTGVALWAPAYIPDADIAVIERWAASVVGAPYSA